MQWYTTKDWLRRQALASIRRPIPQPDKEESYAQDKDYRGDRTHHINPLCQSHLNAKDQALATQVEHENTPDHQLSSQSTEEDNYGATKKSIFPDNFPTLLNSIKEYVTENDGNTYIYKSNSPQQENQYTNSQCDGFPTYTKKPHQTDRVTNP